MVDPNVTASMDDSRLCQSCSFVQDIHNEMCDKPGILRPHWEYFGRSLDTMGKDELARRYREARRLIRDNDVTYNIYNDPQGMGRPWDLDLIPLLIGSEEWSHIEAGLIQRAELLNLVLADLYGPRQLIEKGILPPELVYAFPTYLRPCVGIEHMDGRYLHLYAADLARNPDGEFQVIADRTQAPSGAGYALENRIVLSRVMPSLFRDSHVHRLASFFRTMRNTLSSLAAKPDMDPRIVLLSPGVGNESYFEHAYLANYPGYTLVQGLLPAGGTEAPLVTGPQSRKPEFGTWCCQVIAHAKGILQEFRCDTTANGMRAQVCGFGMDSCTAILQHFYIVALCPRYPIKIAPHRCIPVLVGAPFKHQVRSRHISRQFF